jgi:aminopeptidase N
MHTRSRATVSLSLAFLLTLAAVLDAAPPAFLNDVSLDEPDPHSLLWEPKQQAFERLEQALAMPYEAARAAQDDYDVLFYDIDIAIDPPSQTVDGVVMMRAASVVGGLSTVILDLYDNLTVTSVTRGANPLSYSRSNNRITATLDQPFDEGEIFEITVAYGGDPVNGALDFDTHGGGWPIVSSLSEPDGAREWWPCKDTPADKADSARIAITVPDNLVAASEGTLMSVTDNGDGTKTYEWFEGYPVTTYLVSVAISNYASWTDYYNYGRGTMPVTHYVYPEHLAAAEEDLSITPDAIGILAGLYGEYPFLEEKYGHAVFPWGGAMEHQTCTSYGAVLIRGDHYYDWILVHELSHQWWGDCVTCRTWEDIWLNEGFASYSEALWTEEVGGFEDYKDYMDYFDYYGYFDGPIYDPWQLFGRTVYKKGAWVLHMLRHVLGGRGELLEALSDYRDAHAYGTATTSEFQAAAEGVYGAGLDWFFVPWVYGMNRPEYEYGWIASDAASHWDILLHIDQVQTDAGLFTMPIDIVIETAAGDDTVSVWNDQLSQDFFLTADAEPTGLLFDPDNWILKDVSYAGTGVFEDDPAGRVALSVSTNPSPLGATLTYTTPTAGHVRLAIYDVSGRLVRTLVDSEVPAETRAVTWSGADEGGADVAAGVYFARLVTENAATGRKILIVR